MPLKAGQRFKRRMHEDYVVLTHISKIGTPTFVCVHNGYAFELPMSVAISAVEIGRWRLVQKPKLITFKRSSC